MYGILKKRKYGQNFLYDKNILRKISELIIVKNAKIIEIGPGDGNLTSYILNYEPKFLKLIEVDTDLIQLLNQKFNEKNIQIIHKNVLSYELIDEVDLIISNLPYNISSQILVKICLMKYLPKKLILMFQKEFSQRLLDRKLNSLNSLVNCFYDVKHNFDISRNCFRPIPKVDSSVLVFSKRENSLLETFEVESFIKFKRKLFSYKRKKLSYVLKQYNFLETNDRLSQRVEDISLKYLIELFRKINS